jgi:hypothetical protein
MTSPLDEKLAREVAATFRMPAMQTMVSRKSTITNAFVCALVPVIDPTPGEIHEALTFLGMKPSDVRCVYCGDKKTQWDHLRPIVTDQRPTGFISEIANLVPACSTCNSSKGSANWRDWMLSGRGNSPSARGVADLAERVARLETFVRWRTPTQINFKTVLGERDWDDYWRRWEAVNDMMRECQEFANVLRARVASSLGAA